MPVEVSRIKGRLRELFPKANLSNKRLDEVSARLAKKPSDDADEAAIDLVLQNANDFISFEDIAREDDRIRTLEAQVQKPNPTPEPTPTPNDPTPKPADDTPSWAKSLFEANEKLASQLEEIKSGKITETKTQTARQLFEKNETFKNLKEKGKEFYFGKIDVNSETSIEDQIAEIAEVHNELVQDKADSTQHSSHPPMNSGNEKLSDADLDSIVANASR